MTAVANWPKIFDMKINFVYCIAILVQYKSDYCYKLSILVLKLITSIIPFILKEILNCAAQKMRRDSKVICYPLSIDQYKLSCICIIREFDKTVDSNFLLSSCLKNVSIQYCDTFIRRREVSPTY